MNTIPSDPPSSASVRQGRQTRSLARHLPLVARALLGLFLLASGTTGLLHLTPPPPPDLPPVAVAFDAALTNTGYMMPLIFGTQVLTAVLLLFNRFVPLALTLLAPFLVNSFAFHLFLVPQGLVIVAVLGALELYLAWSYRQAFLPMLTAQVPVAGT